MSFNKLFENVLGASNQTNNGDPGLKQGARFNGMQQKIVNMTIPSLSLIEETSMPHLGSLIETLANPESTESSLEKIDKKEFLKLKALEDNFSKKLAEYVTAYKANLNESLHGECSEVVWGEREEGYLRGHIRGERQVNSLSKAKIACEANDICKGVGACCGPNPTRFRLRTSDILRVDRRAGGRWGASSWIKSCASNKEKIKLLNNELLQISTKMWEQTQKIHTVDVDLQKTIDKKRVILKKRIKDLNKERNILTKLQSSHQTLESELEDNKLQINAQYYHYLVWFVAASTLSIVIFHKMAK